MDLVIGTPPTLAAAQPELGRYCTLTGTLPVGFAGVTVADLRAAAVGASSLFLLGDVPTVARQEDLYGHGQLREETHDQEIMRGTPVGRLDATRLGGVDPVAATRAYLARFCDHWQVGPALPFRRTFTDGFSDQYPQFTTQAQSQFSRLPSSLMEYHPAADSNVSGPYGPGAALRASPGCFWECFGGGMGPDWMWNQGQAPTWKANPVRALYCGIFGSFLGEVHQPDCLMNAVVASWPDTLFCILNYYALFPWWRFLAGEPIGRVAMGAGGTLTNLVGSPLVRLPQEVVDMIALLKPFQDQLDAVKADLAALKAQGSTGTGTVTGSGSTGIVVTLARYRVVSHPEVDSDGLPGNAGKTLAYVRAQVAAGKPVAATDALGDPWFGQAKELYVEFTRAGVADQVVVPQNTSRVIV